MLQSKTNTLTKSTLDIKLLFSFLYIFSSVHFSPFNKEIGSGYTQDRPCPALGCRNKGVCSRAQGQWATPEWGDELRGTSNTCRGEMKKDEAQEVCLKTYTNYWLVLFRLRYRNVHSLPHRVTVGRVLGQVLQQLQQRQLDALFSRDVRVAQQLMKGLSDVPWWILNSRQQRSLITKSAKNKWLLMILDIC